jgi:hypothetical protein
MVVCNSEFEGGRVALWLVVSSNTWLYKICSKAYRPGFHNGKVELHYEKVAFVATEQPYAVQSLLRYFYRFS